MDQTLDLLANVNTPASAEDTTALSLRLTATERAELDALASLRNVKVGTLARQLISDSLSHERRNGLSEPNKIDGVTGEPADRPRSPEQHSAASAPYFADLSALVHKLATL